MMSLRLRDAIRAIVVSSGAALSLGFAASLAMDASAANGRGREAGEPVSPAVWYEEKELIGVTLDADGRKLSVQVRPTQKKRWEQVL
jgi:hypothetical protein